MKTIVCRLSVLAMLVPMAAGCVHTQETIIRDETRTPVTFESDSAARIFYESLSRQPNAGQQEESRTQVSIPIVFDHERKVVTGPNRAFNEAVARCDLNHDGIITDQEARIYAGANPSK